MLAVEALKKGDNRDAQREIDAARLWPENLGAGKPYPADVDERLEDLLTAQALEEGGRHAEAVRLLEAITAFAGRSSRSSRDRGAGTLVHALALRKTGREAEGRKLLADWSARKPPSALAAWSARAFEGEVSPPPDAAGEEARVLAAWLGGPAR